MIIHTNKLGEESSPYLLQHANNPVHWFAWGNEALQAAKAEDKPILVSIGYAACHWCHVMEKESFENEAVASLMNKYFINIKIDREERPDLDHIYMDAVQAIAGNGGWPLNVFLTPDAKPFFGGTYFPPQKAFNRPSWTDVLESINDAWLNRRSEVEEQAAQLISHIEKSNSFASIKNVFEFSKTESLFTAEACKTIKENLLKNADENEGGFGNPPKFPQTFLLQYLLQHAYFFNDEKALQHAEFSLQKMISGGIYDQLGGGLSRYSTDGHWLVPHFEKMLYDNALLLNVLCDAYQVTKKDFYKEAIQKTVHFLITEMKDAEGGFYTAIDADSEGIEGKFYVWQKKEVNELLTEDSELFCTFYNITETGNWEEKNILHITRPANVVAAQFKIPVADFTQKIIACREKLLAARNKRIRPSTDDKILLGWNALLITAFCKAYAALNINEYRNLAVELYDFIESKFINKQGGLFHTYKKNKAKYPGFLDDYAYYIQACIHLQEITGNQDYLIKAKALAEFVLQHFNDTESNLLFYTGQAQQDVVVRKIEVYDGATPSGNSIMAHNLLYLSIVFDKKEWKTIAANMITGMSDIIKKYPGSFGVWAAAYLKLTAGINEIAVTGKDHQAILPGVLQIFNPFKILQSGSTDNEFPLLKGKEYTGTGEIYFCRDYSCEKPVKSVAELELLIKKSKNIIT